MASDQVENGFVQIALPIFGALMGSDLPYGCSVVLAEVLAQSYGPLKRRDVFLDPRDFEQYASLAAKDARRAIKKLVDWRYLRLNANGSYTFLKDRDTWMPHGISLVERIRGAVLKFAESLQGRFGPIKRNSNQIFEQGVSQPPIGGQSTPSDSPSEGVSQPPLNDFRGGQPAPLRLNGTGANSELRIENKEETEECLVASQAQRDPKDQKILMEAVRLLSGLNSGPVAMELQRCHAIPENIQIPGWKWLLAAKRFLEFPISKHGNWKLYRGIVRGIGDDEHPSLAKPKKSAYVEPPAPEVPKATGPGTYDPGPNAPKFFYTNSLETQARRRREAEKRDGAA